MDLADESLAELFEQYKDEVKETIGTLDSELVAIEQDPTDSEVIFSIFRHLHSLKGSSRMFNVDNIGHIAHKLEDLMQIIDQDNSIMGRHPKIIDLLFRGNDIFQEIISRLDSDITYVNLTEGHAGFIEEITHQLDAINRQGDALIDITRTMLDELDALLPGMEELDTDRLRRLMGELNAQIDLATMEEGAKTIAYSYGDLDLTSFIQAYETGLEKFRSDAFQPEDVDIFLKNVNDMIGELFGVAEEDIMGALGELNDGLLMFSDKSLEIDAIVIEFFSELLTDLKENLKSEVVTEATAPEKEEGEATPKPSAPKEREALSLGQAKTIRVDEKKIDIFLESVGKLITQSEILNHLQFSFKGAGLNPALVRDFASVNRTISNDIVNLQKSIMEVRQVEMNNILKKFPRLIRDISHNMEKEVELVVTGERIPIDKSLLDDVEAAMIHLVRNSIDHGLETPTQRESAGKDRRGRISIDVSQEETAVIVEVSDDGLGLDFEAVRKKALERGLISPDKYETMTEQETQQLVFKSGLTTKKEATDISGRGVGMDVVLANIKKWNGEVVMESQVGLGLSVRLQIPITNTLLTKEAILLKLGTSTFCLPLDYVVEIVTIPAQQVHRHKDNALFEHRNQVISVVNMRELLGMYGTDDGDAPNKTFIILRGKTETQKAIVADEILGQQKIVIKDFELDSFRRLPYYQGLTLMGDGRVVLILDGEKIVD